MTDRGASQFEIKAIRAPKAARAPESHYDVAILGGGLAGLTLSLHLKRERPETSVLLVEKRETPPPEAAFKVGESTVEVGAYYFREKCGMKDHLNERHLRKAGLRYFWPAGDNKDLSKRIEYVTPDQFFNHQIDRGRFERECFERTLKLGTDAFRGYRVRDVEIGPEHHTISMETSDGGTKTVTARWVVDASGRANILRRKLGLEAETDHNINAAWFRLDGGLDVESLSDNQEWIDRVPERGFRKLATVHLVDQGYWVWMIPLASGPHSIGVCADPRFHPFDRINEFDRLLDWFKEHEPPLGTAVEQRIGDVMDFLVIENFSYASTQIFSSDRWSLVGEAGGFIDAYYSPGSDYIAYTNSMTKDLICRDLAGEDIEEAVEFYNFFYFQLFEPTISLYKDKYRMFNNPQVMLGKTLYDNNAYFATLAFMFTHDKMTDLDALGDITDMFQTLIPLLGRMQELFSDWHELYNEKWEGVSIATEQFTPMIERQRDLSRDLSDEEFFAKARKNVEELKALALWLFHKAAVNLPDPPDPEARINPLAVSLHPERWEEEGLFSDDGWTLAEATAMLPGVEEFWLASQGATAVPA
jgi:flavin-dependent dehydrogenase